MYISKICHNVLKSTLYSPNSIETTAYNFQKMGWISKMGVKINLRIITNIMQLIQI